MRALRVARTVDAPDWLIGGGVIRDRVWDHLHGFPRGERAKDVDLAFFERSSLECELERTVLRELTGLAPDIAWDVTNQAGAHTWYQRTYGVALPPLRCAADAVGLSPQTATAVGVRLRDDGSIEVLTPCGLGDLFGLLCRRNPRFPAEPALPRGRR